MKEKIIRGLLALLLSAPAALWAANPAPPYYSLQLSTNRIEAEATKNLAAAAGADQARIEKRGEFFSVRVGAWATRDEAKAALKEFRSRGYQDAAILRIVNPVAWVTPQGPAVTPAQGADKAEPPVVEAATAPPAAPPSIEIPPEKYDFRAAAMELDDDLHRLLRTGGLARRDGYIYTLDAAPLLLYAARRGDRTLYTELLELSRPLVWQRAKDPYTRGFVVWRYKKGEPPEVSGATEALHLARGLWAGAEVFNRPLDRTLSLQILEGYGQHVYELGGDWMVRKYYSFASRIFANLSTITSYHPDFLAEVERAQPRQSGPSLSERSYGTLERAVTESGLLYPLIQPEVNQTYPGLDLEVYAPNNVVGLADSCDAAEGAVRGRPRIARDVLKFAADKDHSDDGGRLYAYFRADDGRHIGSMSVAPTVYACLARLAAALDDDDTLERLKPVLQLEMKTLAAVPQVQEAPLYVAGPLLLAAEAMGAFKQ